MERFGFGSGEDVSSEAVSPWRPIGASSVLCGAFVLLVGEDISRLRPLARSLREEGVTLVTATSAPESLVRVTAQRPDVVIVDAALGTTLAGLLAAVSPELPIIVLTAAIAARDERIRANARAHVLHQPCTHAELLGLVEQLLTEPRMRAR